MPMKLLYVAAVANAALTLDASFGNNEPARFTALTHIDLTLIGNLGADLSLYTSLQGKLEGNAVVQDTDYSATASADGSVEANAVFAGLVTGTTVYPSSFVANFAVSASASAEANAEIEAEQGELANAASWASGGADVSGAAGLIAHSIVDVQEIDADGNQVAQISMKGAIPTQAGFRWSAEKVNNQDAGLRSTKHTGVYKSGFGKASGFEVSITLVASERSGLLSTGGMITPSSIEMMYTLKDYTYANINNRLRMRMAVASASATGSASASGVVNGAVSADAVDRIRSGSGNSAMFIDLAKVCKTTAGGADVAVDVDVSSATGSAQADGLAGIDMLGGSVKAMVEGAAQAAGSGDASVDFVTVTFPAGADEISYDPTMGVGDGADPEGNSAAAVTTSFAAILSILLAAIV